MVEEKEPAGPKKTFICRAMVLMFCQRFLSVFSLMPLLKVCITAVGDKRMQDKFKCCCLVSGTGRQSASQNVLSRAVPRQLLWRSQWCWQHQTCVRRRWQWEFWEGQKEGKNGAATHKGTNGKWTCWQQLQKSSCGGLNVSESAQCCTEKDRFGCSSSVHGQMSFSHFFQTAYQNVSGRSGCTLQVRSRDTGYDNCDG